MGTDDTDGVNNVNKDQMKQWFKVQKKGSNGYCKLPSSTQYNFVPKDAAQKPGDYEKSKEMPEAPLESTSAKRSANFAKALDTMTLSGDVVSGVPVVAMTYMPRSGISPSSYRGDGSSASTGEVVGPPAYHCYRGAACTTYDWR